MIRIEISFSTKLGLESIKKTLSQKVMQGKRGRKPTPDGVSVLGNIKTYWEDKRPSECSKGGNSWLSTYKKDPIKDQRIKAKEEYKTGTSLRPEAECKIIIAEHDDHYQKKGKRWNDPEEIGGSVAETKLGLRMPIIEENVERFVAIERILRDTSRNPQSVRGIIYRVIFDPIVR